MTAPDDLTAMYLQVARPVPENSKMYHWRRQWVILPRHGYSNAQGDPAFLVWSRTQEWPEHRAKWSTVGAGVNTSIEDYVTRELDFAMVERNGNQTYRPLSIYLSREEALQYQTKTPWNVLARAKRLAASMGYTV